MSFNITSQHLLKCKAKLVLNTDMLYDTCTSHKQKSLPSALWQQTE